MRTATKRSLTLALALILTLPMGGESRSASAVPEGFDRPHVGGRLVVGFRSGSPQQWLRLHDRRGTDVLRSFGGIATDVIRVDPNSSLEDVAQKYLQSPLVERVHPVYPVRPKRVPNDPRFPEQYHLDNTGQTGGVADADIDAPEGWDVATSTPVRIAVVDTGINPSHPDVQPNVVDTIRQGECPNFVSDCEHATMIAGVAAARGNNGSGVTGVAWEAGIINVPFDFLSTGVVEAFMSVADYAESRNVRVVVTAAFGSEGPCPPDVSDAIDYARARGVLIVAAAGNDGGNNDSNPEWPTNCPQDNVIAVASTTAGDQLSSFSNFGARTVDLAAPGSQILTTDAPNGFSRPSGTSVAVPVVAGAAALVWGRDTSQSHVQVRAKLFDTVDKVPSLSGRVATGGRLNLARALGASPGAPPTPGPTTPPASTAPSPVPVPEPAPPGGGGSITGTTFSAGGGGLFCLFGFSGCGGSQARAGVTVVAGDRSATSGADGRYALSQLVGTRTVSASLTTSSQSLFSFGAPSSVACSADSPGGPTQKTVDVPDGGTVTIDWHCPSGGGGFAGFGGLFSGFSGFFGFPLFGF